MSNLNRYLYRIQQLLYSFYDSIEIEEHTILIKNNCLINTNEQDITNLLQLNNLKEVTKSLLQEQIKQQYILMHKQELHILILQKKLKKYWLRQQHLMLLLLLLLQLLLCIWFCYCIS